MSTLFGGGKPTPPPAPAAPAPIPDSQSPLVLEAQRREQASILSRGGRSSTILSDTNDSNQDNYGRRTFG